MLQNSILHTNDDKIDFLVSEIETANTKISFLSETLQKLLTDKEIKSTDIGIEALKEENK